MAKGRHKNTQMRIRLVSAIVQTHYQEGVQARCYKAVWRKHVYPIYPMCYHTFLTYINAPRGAQRPEEPSLFD